MEKYVEIFNSYHEKNYFDDMNNIEIVKKKYNRFNKYFNISK